MFTLSPAAYRIQLERFSDMIKSLVSKLVICFLLSVGCGDGQGVVLQDIFVEFLQKKASSESSVTLVLSAHKTANAQLIINLTHLAMGALKIVSFCLRVVLKFVVEAYQIALISLACVFVLIMPFVGIVIWLRRKEAKPVDASLIFSAQVGFIYFFH